MNTSLWFEIGKQLYASGKYEEAIRNLDIALVNDTNNADVLVTKAEALIYLGKYDEGIECADKALAAESDEGESNDPIVLANKAEALAYLGKYEEGIECVDKALNFKPVSVYALYVKGLIVDYRGDQQAALSYFDNAIGLDQNDFNSWTNKGIALNYLRNHTEALKCFDNSIRILEDIKSKSQDLGYVLVNKALTLSTLNDELRSSACYNEAMKYLEKCIETNPNDSHSWMMLGVSFYQLGWFGRATKCFDEVIRINPRFHHTWYLRGVLAADLGRNKEAVNYFDKALEINPNDPDYLTSKGIALYRLGRYEDAANCFGDAISKDEEYLIAYLKRGDCKYKLEHYDAALEDYAKVTDPKYDSSKYNNVGVCYHKKGSKDQAGVNLKKAIKSGKSAVACYNLAAYYYNSGEKGKAKKYLEECLEVDSSFDDADQAIKDDADQALKDMRHSDTSNWFDWWFEQGNIKRRIGITLIIATLSLVIGSVALVGYVSFHKQEFTVETITGLIVMTTLLVIILLSPSLRKVKVLDIELEIEPAKLKETNFKELLSTSARFSVFSY